MNRLWHNGTDWFVAPSVQEAQRLALLFYDGDLQAAEGELEGWRECHPKQILTITNDDDKSENAKRTRTVDEWIAEYSADKSNVTGFLCSNEF